MAFDISKSVGPGKFKFPLWAWGAAGLAGYYVYTRSQGASAPGEAAAPQDAAYDSYDAYSPGYGDLSYGGTGSGASDGGFAPVEPLPAETLPPVEPELPPDGDAGGGGMRNRRHRLQALKQRREAIGGRIQHLRAGGVTTGERRKVRKLRTKRKAITRRIHRVQARR